MTTQSLLARRNQALGAGAPLFYKTPLHIVRGDGVYLFDATGRRYERATASARRSNVTVATPRRTA